LEAGRELRVAVMPRGRALTIYGTGVREWNRWGDRGFPNEGPLRREKKGGKKKDEDVEISTRKPFTQDMGGVKLA